MGPLRIILCLLLLSFQLHAAADRQDWIGEYSINHDGHLGRLRISPSIRKCRSMPCPGLEVRYADEHGAMYAGSVDVLDDDGQHMAFTIDFPGNPQAFHVYIFSFDKSKLAGTTVWGNRTFGVFATKLNSTPSAAEQVVKPARGMGAMLGERMSAHSAVATGLGSSTQSTASTGGSTHVLLPNGSVEVHYPDGKVLTKRIGACGGTMRYPDGHTSPVPCTYLSVTPVIPPTPPAGSPEERWLKGQDDTLLSILQKVLGGANSTDFQNYTQAYENPANSSLYQRIYFRTRAISELTSNPQ